MVRKIMIINSQRVEVILPKGMKASDIPNEIRTKHKIANVGIMEHQKERIKNLPEIIKNSRSINSFVQEAVEDKLNDASRDLTEK